MLYVDLDPRVGQSATLTILSVVATPIAVVRIVIVVEADAKVHLREIGTSFGITTGERAITLAIVSSPAVAPGMLIRP